MDTETLSTEEIVAKLKSWAAENKTLLQEQGVDEIVGAYSGSGDQGCFDCVEAVKSDGMPAEYDVPSSIEKLLEELFDSAVDSGYEDSEGGGGQLILEIETGKVRHTSYYNVTVQEDCGGVEL